MDEDEAKSDSIKQENHLLKSQEAVERLKGEKIDWSEATEGELFLLLMNLFEKGPYLKTC